MDSSDAAARLKSITSGAAWKAVNGIGLAAGLSGKYKQFVLDEAVLDTDYAAAISGGPPTSLKGALSKLSTDCRKGRSNSPSVETAPVHCRRLGGSTRRVQAVAVFGWSQRFGGG